METHKTIMLRVPVATHAKLKTLADANLTTMAGLIKQALANHLKSLEPKHTHAQKRQSPMEAAQQAYQELIDSTSFESLTKDGMEDFKRQRELLVKACGNNSALLPYPTDAKIRIIDHQLEDCEVNPQFNKNTINSLRVRRAQLMGELPQDTEDTLSPRYPNSIYASWDLESLQNEAMRYALSDEDTPPDLAYWVNRLEMQ